jgi:hypothetical protein
MTSTIAAVFDVKQAIKEILTGGYTPTDSVRLDAQKQILHITEGRIQTRRRPTNVGGEPTITVISPVSEPDDDLSGRGTCATSNVEVRVFSRNERQGFVLWDAVAQLLTGFSGITVTTIDGNMIIGGTWLIEHGEPDADEPIDASDEWTFEYIGVFGVSHQVKAATGFS